MPHRRLVAAGLPALICAVLAPAALRAAGPPTECRIAVAASDNMSEWCQIVSQYETYAGTGCEPMSIASGSVWKYGVIPTGLCGFSIGDASKAFMIQHRIVPRGTVPASFKADCIPWRANIRCRTGLGRATPGVSASLEVGLYMPDANHVMNVNGQLNAHLDTTITGCMPASLIMAKRGSFSSGIRASLSLFLTNESPDDAVIEGQIIGDPWVVVDPAWPDAGLFKVEQETQNGSGVWVEIDRSWIDGTTWTDATSGQLAQPGGDAASAWGDYDDDGLIDVCIVNSVETNRLLHNQGGGNFEDATPPALAAVASVYQAKWVDFDNDSRLDLFLTRSNNSNRLLRNEGSGVFTDITPAPLQNVGYNRDAAWADYDRDGDLDVFLVSCFSGNRLLRHNADGTFENVTPAPLLDTTCCMGAMWADYDNDGDPDLYIVRRDDPNRLFRNDGGGVFTDVTATSLVGDAGAGQGAAWGDYDNDGRLDLYVVNNGTNRLYHNQGGGGFADSTDSYTSSASYGIAGSWSDVDNDGDLDLYVQESGHRNELLVNMGNHAFDYAMWHSTGPIEQISGAGHAVVDFDDDGDLDVYLSRTGANAALRNDLPAGQHWLEVDLRGGGTGPGVWSNSFGVGARVRVVSADGQARIREVSASQGRFGGHPLRQHFGLGAQARVDTLEVRWPSGRVTRSATPFAADRRVTVHENGMLTGLGDEPGGPPQPVLFQNAPNPFNPCTTIRYELPRAAQVRLGVYDVKGRFVRSLVNGRDQAAGRYEVRWDGRDDWGRACGSGVYFYRLEAGGYADSGKMALLN